MKLFSLAISVLFIGVLITGHVYNIISIDELTLMMSASAVTFMVYAWDKYKAVKQGYRVSENTLHILALIGGWPGAAIAQQVLRHKTIKASFRRWFWLCVITNMTILSYYYFY